MATSWGSLSLLVRRTVNAVLAGATMHEVLKRRFLAEMAMTLAESACAHWPPEADADAPALQAASAKVTSTAVTILLVMPHSLAPGSRARLPRSGSAARRGRG